jgi:PIN domain nuclease of toxin-antitoxin system
MGFEPDRLGDSARTMLEDSHTLLFVSLVTAWEIAIKSAAGKLSLPTDVQTYVRTRLTISRATLLPIVLDHVFPLGSLPNHHRDPFDRMLVAQAQVDGLTLVSADPRMLAYEVASVDARE